MQLKPGTIVKFVGLIKRDDGSVEEFPLMQVLKWDNNNEQHPIRVRYLDRPLKIDSDNFVWYDGFIDSVWYDGDFEIIDYDFNLRKLPSFSFVWKNKKCADHV